MRPRVVVGAMVEVAFGFKAQEVSPRRTGNAGGRSRVTGRGEKAIFAAASRVARAGVAEWQTRQTQNLLPVREWGFKSLHPHQRTMDRHTRWCAEKLGQTLAKRTIPIPRAPVSEFVSENRDASFGLDGEPEMRASPSFARIIECFVCAIGCRSACLAPA